MNYELFVEKVIVPYNSCFWGFFSIVIFSFVFVGIILYLKKKSEDDKRWYKYIFVLKKKVIEMLILLFMFWILIIFLNDAFSIDLIVLLDLSQYWKIIFSIWIIKCFFSGKKLYEALNFFEFLRKVRDGEYRHTSPENIMISEMERYNSNYTLQVERLGILKSLAPISLLPLIVGYVLEGKNIVVDWNWYTVALFSILFIYFYNVWKCYSNMKFWKIRAGEVQTQLRDMQFEKEYAKDSFL